MLLIIVLAGMAACIVVPLLVGRGSMWKRAAIGIGWAIVDLLAWWGLMFLAARVYRPDGTDHLTSAHALYVADHPDAPLVVAGKVAAELLALGAAALVPLGSIS